LFHSHIREVHVKTIPKILVLPLTLAFFGGMLVETGNTEGAETPLADVNVSIKKVGKTWKAVLTGTTNTKVHVVKGQKVIFHAEGTDVYFQFSSKSLFGGHDKYVKSGQKLTLGVGQVAKGVYTYAAFCTGPKAFAQGDSPPKIIVD